MQNKFERDYIFCCDWGTSSFRLRLVSYIDLKIIDEVKTNLGIAQVFKDWKKQSADTGESRPDFYFKVLKEQIQVLMDRSHIELNHVPVILTGMASSSIGVQDLPYADLPFLADGKTAYTRVFEETSTFQHQIILVSGVKSDKDVMRGEEIQFIGITNLKEIQLPNSDQFVLIFPGTHSKHIYVRNGAMVDFQTFMTGEVFNIISEHSILKDSISSNNSSLKIVTNQEGFEKGVRMSVTSSFLHTLFTVRTNQLFNKLPEEQNYFYLSGLIIGSELKSLSELDLPVVICSGNNLSDYYKLAAEELHFKDMSFVSSDLIEKATVSGQIQVYKNFLKEEIYE